MNTTTNRATRYVFLAAIDESSAADLVIAYAASLARATPGSEIHLLHVPERFTTAPVTAASFDLDRAPRYLEGCARRAREASGAPTVGHLLDRDPGHAILQLAAQIDADFILVGTRDKPAPERWLMGSVAQKVMQHAACPVLVVRPKAHLTYRAPEIEPPCPDCLRQQAATRGAKMWCARHAEHHPRAHVYYEMSEGFGAGSSLILPSGDS